MDGRLVDALAQNPLVFAVGAAAAIAAVAAPLWVAARLPVLNSRGRFGVPARWTAAGVFLANWAYVAWRNSH